MSGGRILRRLVLGPIRFVILDELANAAYALEVRLEAIGLRLEDAAARHNPHDEHSA